MGSTVQRPPWAGAQASLVISFDIGTTYSGASYVFLTPGEVPQIHSVTGYQGQENQNSSHKVPTVVVYDDVGTLAACGAEACEDFMLRNPDHLKVEWFKLLLRPNSFERSSKSPHVLLPPNKNVVEVFADFMSYLKSCVQKYIQETTVDGPAVWERLSSTAQYVLTHPNGWAGYQLKQMRDAAIRAGLVPDAASAQERIEFVSEGEASFHWCVDTGLATGALTKGSEIVVADAGGGTIDVTSFRVTGLKPLQLKEAAAAECRLAGSIFVTKQFTALVQGMLKGTPYEDEERIQGLTEQFEEKTKGLFRDDSIKTYIKIASRTVFYSRKKDPNGLPDITIARGALEFEGDWISKLFENSCSGAVEAIKTHLRSNNAYVFLVGGFAASPWLFNEVNKGLAGKIRDLRRAESQTAKAVAHGAIVFHLDRANVKSRVAKYTYGTDVQWDYDGSDTEHIARGSQTNEVTGKQVVRGGFDAIVWKGETVEHDAIYRSQYILTYKTQAGATGGRDFVIYRYVGALDDFAFMDMDPGNFREVCRISMKLPLSAYEQRGGPKGPYWFAEFEVILDLGATELKASLEWKEDGVEKRSVAVPIWEDV